MYYKGFFLPILFIAILFGAVMYNKYDKNKSITPALNMEWNVQDLKPADQKPSS